MKIECFISIHARTRYDVRLQMDLKKDDAKAGKLGLSWRFQKFTSVKIQRLDGYCIIMIGIPIELKINLPSKLSDLIHP